MAAPTPPPAPVEDEPVKEVPPGVVLKGPDGQFAVSMAPNVTAYRYFVIHPENGGHPVPADSPEAQQIATWPQMEDPK
jgi:hypothetical protein